MAPTASILFYVYVWSTISHRRSLLSTNRSRIWILDTSTSSILCKTWCGTSASAIRGSRWYAGCCIPFVFSFLLLLVYCSPSSPLLSTLFSTFFFPCALIITNPPTFFFSLSNSAIAPHTNSFSSTCVASTNELSFVGVVVVLVK